MTAPVLAPAGPAHRFEPRIAERGRRLAFIDNLRWTMIVLVISMHAADTYSPLGSWYYVERPRLGAPTLLAFAAWQLYLQSFFMGLLFFVAGVFAPASLDRKGTGRFIRDRAFRLGLPVLFYMFVLGPVTEYFFAHSWNSTEPTSFANEWIKHIRNGQFMQENGPLWFCLALLVFSVAYAGLRAWRGPARGPARAPTRDGDRLRDSAPPTTLALIGFAVAIAAGRFVLHLVLPPGTSVLNMHLGDFSQYVFLFVAGIAAARRGWLPRLSHAAGLRWLRIVLPLGFVAWLAIVASGVQPDGSVHLQLDGWHWQSAAMSLWESLTCVALSLGLLVVFRERFNSQGRLARFLSDNAFSVYVFHPPIVIAGARLLHEVALAPFAKFVVLTIISTIVTFSLSALVFRRIPILRAIL